MKQINWKVRLSNPIFYFQLGLSILTPIMLYFGVNASDITTWNKLFEILYGAVSNPFVLMSVVISVYNSVIDPTTKGFGDSKNALTYQKPNE